MPYPPDHTAKVRQRIVAAARALFNRHGYESVTIDAVMRAAGMTRGAFYFHFKSKAQLYREAIAYVLVEHPAGQWISASDRRPLRDKIIEAYLGAGHLKQTEDSCPLVTHAAEASRYGPEAQAAFRSVFNALTDVLAGTDRTKREEGLALACLCVGGVSLARGVGDPALANDIIKAARNVARALARSEDRAA